MVIRSLAFVAISFSVLFVAPAPAGESPPWKRSGDDPDVTGYFRVRVKPGRELAVGVNARDVARTGDFELDELCRRHGVIRVAPLIRRAARHRDPAAFAASGLDREYLFVLDRSRNDLAEVVAAFARARAVERADPDGVAGHCGVPNDPDFAQQWGMQPLAVDGPTLWDHVTSSGALTAVVDTGIDVRHADIDQNVWVNPGEIAGNGLDDDGNGYVDDVNGYDVYNDDGKPQDDNGHGTHVAGIVGAEGNNSLDVAGVMWSVPIVAVKVLNYGGSGTFAAMAEGITYAADLGCAVSNYSFGSSIDDPLVAAAVQYAADLDVVQVAAAGNSSSTAEFYPAANHGVIAVIATDATQARASFSNFGDWCDLSAPGDSILSLLRGGGTILQSGTSMASPHVAGVAAMVRGVNPGMDRLDVELALEHSCTDLGFAGDDLDFGWGLLHGPRAWERAESVHASAGTVLRGGSVDLTIHVDTTAQDLYLLLPTISGREPGIDLSAYFASETRVLPLNPDFVTDLSLLLPNIGVFDQFIGTLDAAGSATATINVPTGALFLGETLHFSLLTFDAITLQGPLAVGGSIGVEVQ